MDNEVIDMVSRVCKEYHGKVFYLGKACINTLDTIAFSFHNNYRDEAVADYDLVCTRSIKGVLTQISQSC